MGNTTGKGGFQKGLSGNPGGRPRGVNVVNTLAREHTKAAIDRLKHWMDSDNAKASVSACVALLDRGWGKPSQSLGLTGEGGGPLQIEDVTGMNPEERRKRIDELLRKRAQGII